ncbi:FYSH domain-containing protein [Conidiobolus coronatus NRRL 28638]|uniref:FYSH domain-containing protein n=1 Tax=Conidiobolus coronatus (strain ATCC 28846 / CBS 209.66 / NRRL 28638) TaxID=796925 RepID=A0A137PBI0_CONC2|nr:FYSH domain-containing protein [Conidiobolus coronatus NRRL 28638]|eukprot:KXN72291.1 FYSH domain-containing protein [Conidiobolus coronatus NRRL 28638]
MVKETYQAVYKSDESKDLFVYVEDTELLNKWKHDSTIPLAQVVQAFEIYETENGSHTGKATAASKSTISNALGTDDLDKAIKKIITEGELVKAPTFNERVKDI